MISQMIVPPNSSFYNKSSPIVSPGPGMSDIVTPFCLADGTEFEFFATVKFSPNVTGAALLLSFSPDGLSSLAFYANLNRTVGESITANLVYRGTASSGDEFRLVLSASDTVSVAADGLSWGYRIYSPQQKSAVITSADSCSLSTLSPAFSLESASQGISLQSQMASLFARR